MTWSLHDVLAWVARVEARRAQLTLFDVLEVPDSATFDELRDAFHRLASVAHPDQHRRALSADDTERLIRAYSLVTLAYATLRDPVARARYLRELAQRPPTRAPTPPPTRAPTPPPPARATTPPPPAPAPAPATTPPPPARATTPPPDVGGTPTGPQAPTRARGVTSPSFARISYRGGRITGVPVRHHSPSSGPISSGSKPTSEPPPMGDVSDEPPSVPAAPAPPAARVPTTPPRAQVATVATTPPPPTSPPRARSSSLSSSLNPTTPAARAQTYFRKGETAWRQGDLGAALFNLRLAIAADPSSAQYRAALAEIEAEMSGKK